MITDANTVVDPLAMVIKLFNALVADVAMTRVPGENCFASWTQALGIALVNQFTEVEAFSSFDGSWV